MLKTSSTCLQEYAHRTLLRRLLLMTLVITLVVSAMVYILERRRMQEYVAEQASHAVQLIVARYRVIKDEKKLSH